MAAATTARVEELESRLARLARNETLRLAIDRVLEEALRERRPLERAMPRLLEILVLHLGARGAAVHTLDESLCERTFSSLDAPVDPEALDRAARGERRFDHAGGFVLTEPLDVAGESFGAVLVFFD